MSSHDDARKLVDEELMQVSGGEGEPLVPNGPLPPCPNCGTCDYTIVLNEWNDENYQHLYLDLFCKKCKGEWTARYV